MTLPANDGDGAIPANGPAVRNGACDRRDDVLGPLRRAKWNLAVLAELAAPASMELTAVRDPGGRILDFQWQRASPLASLLLGRAGADLTGAALRHFFADEAMGAALFETYAVALRTGQPQMTRVDAGDWTGMYHVSPTSSGVRVMLSSTTAIERVVEAQRALRVLEASGEAGRSRHSARAVAHPPHPPHPRADYL